jgi:hypothetical protein
VRVYPPSERDALTVPGSLQICAGVFDTSNFSPGTGT